MRFTKFEKDWLVIDEDNYQELHEKGKIHLIKLNFDLPTVEKVNEVIDRFPNTKRFIVSENVRFYNGILKNVKKYYVENNEKASLISFFRKNNKIMLNMNNLDNQSLEFVYSNIADILRNVEVIQIDKITNVPNHVMDSIEMWNGNVLIS